MVAASPFSVVFVVVISILGSTTAQLSTNFYSKSCPKVFSTVESVVESAFSSVERAALGCFTRPLVFFHDCFVNGCDGSILLDDTSSFTGEKTAAPNNNSVRGFEVIDAIKAKVERLCPGVVACADILAIAARDSVVKLGGPDWDVKLGRRDSKTASLSGANSGVIPTPTANLTQLINRFRARGLSAKDMVALSGAHTIGQARCVVFRNRIYNERNIERSFAKARQSSCPSASGSGDNNLAPLDVETPSSFDLNFDVLQEPVEQKGSAPHGPDTLQWRIHRFVG